MDLSSPFWISGLESYMESTAKPHKGEISKVGEGKREEHREKEKNKNKNPPLNRNLKTKIPIVKSKNTYINK